MSNVVEAASPYLYPCVIQYSLIATGMCYVIHGLDKRTSKYLKHCGILFLKVRAIDEKINTILWIEDSITNYVG